MDAREKGRPAVRVSGERLRLFRDFLGLTLEESSAVLGVRADTVRRWESGGAPAPAGLGAELAGLEDRTAATVAQLVAELKAMEVAEVVVPITQEQWQLYRPELAAVWPVRWWRHVVGRALDEVPTAAVVGCDR